jgi:hypothetical protein
LNIKTNAKFHLHTKPMHHFIKITMDFEKLQKNKKKMPNHFICILKPMHFIKFLKNFKTSKERKKKNVKSFHLHTKCKLNKRTKLHYKNFFKNL